MSTARLLERMIRAAISKAEGFPAEHSFWEALDSRILTAAGKPQATLASVSSQAGGAFPTVVAERLALHGISLPDDSGGDEAESHGAELHAAEFEWYFTAECARDLAELLAVQSGGVLLLGAPTVAAAFDRGGTRAQSVDRSPFLRERFNGRIGNLHNADLREPLGMLRSHAVVFFDAPWHEDHISRWLWQASLAVRRGGCVAFALFGPTTRAAAKVERVQLLEMAAMVGRVTLHEEVLRYRTPLFEAEALRAAGHQIQGPWRRGDLVVIENAEQALRAPSIPRERAWITRRVEDRVLKLNPMTAHAALGNGPESLGTLESVSRSRIAQLALAVWDSRNGILAAGLSQGRREQPTQTGY